MKNIDKVKQMNARELIKFTNEDKCEQCVYKDSICGSERCTEGRILWLESEVEFDAIYINKSFHNYCYKQCGKCGYKNTGCREQYIIDNFNIIDGKITKRQK